MNGRRIAVIGLYRSGSTAVAGMLHHLGVDMGAPFWGDYYEPYALSKQLRRWWDEPNLTQQANKAERVRAFKDWIEDRESSGRTNIGCKHPLLSLCGEDLIEAWGPETRFIWTYRPLEESIDSIVRLNWWPARREQLQETLWRAVHEFFESTEHLKLHFADTINAPKRQVERLVEYVGLQPTEEQVQLAVEFIQSRDRRHSDSTWSRQKLLASQRGHASTHDSRMTMRNTEADPNDSQQSVNRQHGTPRSSVEKVVATMLSGNSEELVADAVRSAVDWVDEILLIDTGITDGTVEVIRELAGEKFRQTQFAWCDDFALARNTALEEAAKCGATWALTLDTDERLIVDEYKTLDELRQVLADQPQVTTWMVSDKRGTYAKERLIRVPAKQQWRGRTHETVVGASAGQRKVLPGVRFCEVAKTAEAFRRKLERDLVILEEETRDKPNNARWWYYLGQTLDGLKRPREAADAYRHCATLDGWAEEAAWACYQAAKCLSNLGDFEEAILACSLGLSRQPASPELAWLAGHCCYQMGQYRNAIHWEQMAIALGNVAGSKAGERRISFRHLPGWYEGPYDVLRFAYRQLGMKSEADQADADYQRARELRSAHHARSTADGESDGSDENASIQQPSLATPPAAQGSFSERRPPGVPGGSQFRQVVMQTKPDRSTKLDTVSQEFHDIAAQLNNNAFSLSDSPYNLTVSHQSQFLWFRVAKVATRTILKHLREHCGPLDMDHAMFVHYPTNLCREYFKFAFVRNPWERLVSCWQDKVVNENYFRFNESVRQRLMDFSNFVDYVATLDVESCDHHLRLQRKLIDLNHLDFLGRLEAFDDDFLHVCDVLGIPPLDGKHHNNSGRADDLHQYYTRDLANAAYRLYEQDIRLFNYAFD